MNPRLKPSGSWCAAMPPSVLVVAVHPSGTAPAGSGRCTPTSSDPGREAAAATVSVAGDCRTPGETARAGGSLPPPNCRLLGLALLGSGATVAAGTSGTAHPLSDGRVGSGLGLASLGGSGGV